MRIKKSFNLFNTIKLFCLYVVTLTTSVTAMNEPAVLGFKKDISLKQFKIITKEAEYILREPKKATDVMDPILRNHWDQGSEILSKNISKVFDKLSYSKRYIVHDPENILIKSRDNLMYGLTRLIKAMTYIPFLQSVTGVMCSSPLIEVFRSNETLDLSCETTQKQLIMCELLRRVHYFSSFCFNELVETNGEPLPLFGHVEELIVDNYNLPFLNFFFFDNCLWYHSFSKLSWTPNVCNASVIKLDSSGLQILTLAIPFHFDPVSNRYIPADIPKNPSLHLMINAKDIISIRRSEQPLTGIKCIASDLNKLEDPFLSIYLTQSSSVLAAYHRRCDETCDKKALDLACSDANFKKAELEHQEALDRLKSRDYLLELFELERQLRNETEKIASKMKDLMEEKKRVQSTKLMKALDYKIKSLMSEIGENTKRLKGLSDEMKVHESKLKLYDYVITQAVVDLGSRSNIYDPSVRLDPIQEAWVLPIFRKELSHVTKKQISMYDSKEDYDVSRRPVPIQFLIPLPCEQEREQVVQLLELVYAKCCQNVLKGQVMQMIKEQFGSRATVQEIEDEEIFSALPSQAHRDLPATTALDLLDSHQNAPNGQMTECNNSLDAAIEKNMAELADQLIEPSRLADAHSKTSAAQGSADATTSSASPFEEIKDLDETHNQEDAHNEEEWIQLARQAEEAIKQEKAYSKQKKTAKVEEDESDSTEALSKKMQLKALLDIKEGLEESGKLKKGAKDVFRTVAEIMQRAKDMGLFKQVSTTRKGSHVSFHITHSLTKSNRQQDCGALVTIPCNKKEFGKGLLKAIGNQVQNALHLIRSSAEGREEGQRTICEVKELQ